MRSAHTAIETTGPKFRNMVRIAADDVASLRRCDVFRLLDTYRDMAAEFGEWIKANREDLTDEVDECLAELVNG